MLGSFGVKNQKFIFESSQSSTYLSKNALCICLNENDNKSILNTLGETDIPKDQSKSSLI